MPDRNLIWPNSDFRIGDIARKLGSCSKEIQKSFKTSKRPTLPLTDLTALIKLVYVGSSC